MKCCFLKETKKNLKKLSKIPKKERSENLSLKDELCRKCDAKKMKK